MTRAAAAGAWRRWLRPRPGRGRALRTRSVPRIRIEITPERSPDEAAIDRARLESGTVGHVRRAPGRAASAAARGGTVDNGHGAAAGPRRRSCPTAPRWPWSTCAPRGTPRGRRRCWPELATAVKARGGEVVERTAPRRGELQGWIRRTPPSIGVAIEPRAAAALAERIGGAVLESDIERGEQTRVADGELRKLATYAGATGRSPSTDVEALVADTRPASLFAITNAIDRTRAGGRQRGGRAARIGRGPTGAADPGCAAGPVVRPDRGPRPGRERRRAGRASPSGSDVATPAWRSGWLKRRGVTRARSWRRC